MIPAPGTVRTVLSLFFAFAPGVRATIEWPWHKTADGIHPNGPEQQMVWLMNRARANPAAEGDFLAATGNADVQQAINFFGVNIPLMKSEFDSYAARPPAAFDSRLYLAAAAHNGFMIQTDIQTHVGQLERVVAAGFSLATWSGSIFAFAQSAIEAHAAFNIDWGPDANGMQTGRAHRLALMSISPPGMSNVGIAITPESNSQTAVGPLVVSINYAAAQNVANHSNRFIVGTVWGDTNGNNRYDSGEGRSGVMVQPSSGNWHAVTGAAGGYAIPVDLPGNFLLTYSGGNFPGVTQRTVNVGTTSVLVDVMVTTTSTPLQIGIRRSPTSAALILEWSGGVPPYQVQASTTLRTINWRNLGLPTENRSMTVQPTREGEFYRVRSSQ